MKTYTAKSDAEAKGLADGEAMPRVCGECVHDRSQNDQFVICGNPHAPDDRQKYLLVTDCPACGEFERET